MKILELDARRVWDSNTMGYKTHYIVWRVTNSVDPEIGKGLTKDQVKLYCDDPDWKVVIR